MMPSHWCWRCIFTALLLFWAVVASLFFGHAWADVSKTFYWDNVARCGTVGAGEGCWPEGTTVELLANGVSFTGLDGVTMPSGTATVTLPINPGQQVDAVARAVAPDGYQCGNPPVTCKYSEWSNRVYITIPSDPTDPWARYTVAPPPPVSYVNGSIASPGGASGTTWAAPAIATTAGNTLIVGTSGYTSGSTVTGISDPAGNTFVKLGATGGGDATHRMDVWASYNIKPHAANVVTLAYNQATAFRVVAVAQFAGLAPNGYDATSPFLLDASDTSTHSTANTASTSQENELVIVFYVALSAELPVSATEPDVVAVQNSDAALAYRITTMAGQQSVTVLTDGGNQLFISA